MSFKKLIVFDYNLDWNRYEASDKRYKDIDLIKSLYFQAIKSQPVVITSSGWYGDCLDFISKAHVKNGYLIANAGSVIYDIGNKKILEVNKMDKDDVKTIIHHGIMLNLNITISTLEHKYIYISNSVTFNKIKDELYSQFEQIVNYQQLTQIVENCDIIDVAYIAPFDTGKNEVQRTFQYHFERYFDNEVNDIIIKTNQTSPFAHFSSKASTKLKAVQKVMAYANIEHLNDILYIACTCINRECYLNFKNTLISSNPNFIVEIAGAKKPKYIAEEINNLTIDFGKETNSFWK